MKIAIDARMGHVRVGMGVYVRGLVNYFGKIDKTHDYHIILRKDKDDKFVPNLKNYTKLLTSVSYENHLSRDFWEQIYLPLKLNRNNIDVYHGINYMLPCLSNTQQVLTIYDMISFLAPGWYTPISRFRIKSLLRLSARKASKIIAGSYNTKKDILEILDIPDEKVKVIYIGVDSAFKPIDDKILLDYAKSKFNIDRDFILYVGSFHPRKNIPRLLEAFSTLAQDVRENFKLMLVGRPNRKSAEILSKIEYLKLGDKIIIGSANETDLPLLLNTAALLVFPSLYEGFGIPPLEAMACGTPVIASNASSIPEVVGDAALLFDPYNVEEMAAALRRALTDEELRANLRQRGFTRVKQFSWENAAKETLAAYEEVYGEK